MRQMEAYRIPFLCMLIPSCMTSFSSMAAYPSSKPFRCSSSSLMLSCFCTNITELCTATSNLKTCWYFGTSFLSRTC